MKKSIKTVIIVCAVIILFLIIAVVIRSGAPKPAEENQTETEPVSVNDSIQEESDIELTEEKTSDTVDFDLIAPSSDIVPVFAPATSRTNGDGTFTNPFIWADVPDPDVIRIGDVYYMTSTTMYFSPGCPVMKSYDLVNWEIVNYVYDILEDSDAFTLNNGQNAYGKGSWASSLRFYNGTYYVGFASLTTGKTYIYQTEDIENGSWRKSVLDGFYHDLSLLFDDDGRVYLVYGSGTIRVIELTSDATAIKPGGIDSVIIDDSNAITQSGLPAEGAHIYKIDGKYYIFLIAWPQNGTNRRIELCYRSDSIDGEYTGRIVLDDNLGYQNAGVAQGGITDTPDGSWYAMLFQDHGAVGRIPVLVPVAWEDGWPVFGVDGKVPKNMEMPLTARETAPIVTSDEFLSVNNNFTLAKQWQFNHNPDNKNWSLSERAGYLRLTNSQTCESLVEARNTLTQRTFGPECSGNIAIDTSGMNSGDIAGLAALQAKYGYVGVKKEGISRYIVMVDASSGTELEVERVELIQPTVYLRVDFDFTDSDKARFYYSLDAVTWKAIGETLRMYYDLAHFTGYRFALFNFATETPSGYADFDYFRVSDNLPRNPGTVLTSALGVKNGERLTVNGANNTEFEIPVILDALPEDTYEGIYISITLPEYVKFDSVGFKNKNITGTTGYAYKDKRLQLFVTGDDVSFSHNESDIFAIIKFRVDGFVPEDMRISIKPEYIHVKGGSAAYITHGVQALVTLTYSETGALAKIPGQSNPLISHKFGADPYAITYDGQVYVYLTSDKYEYDSKGNATNNTYGKINSITILSSTDMVNWTDYGEVYVSGMTGATMWAKLSWAPAVAHKVINGEDKFFLYFSNGAGGIGVLTSSTPVGPWHDPIGKALINYDTPGTEGVVWYFDPAVLVDDDGTGYLYFGGGLPGDSTEDALHPNTARVVQLGDDMTSLAGSAVPIDAPAMFEDSGIHKYNGKYYYSYCANFSGPRPEGYPPHGEIAYMIADNPMGPFTYAGPVLKNPSHFFGIGGNNHHCFFEFNDEWYIAYHAQTLNKAMGEKAGGYRSPHINKVEYDENGFIKQIAADMKGVSLPITVNPYEQMEAETFAWNSGISTYALTDPGVWGQPIHLAVTGIDNGDWMAVANVNFDANGTDKFYAQVLAKSGGSIEIVPDSPFNEAIGTLTIPAANGEADFTELSCDVESITGVHDIYFVFKGTGEDMFDFDCWKFSK